jgi:hypothetical protein
MLGRLLPLLLICALASPSALAMSRKAELKKAEKVALAAKLITAELAAGDAPDDIVKKLTVELKAQLGLCAHWELGADEPGRPASLEDCLRGTEVNSWDGQLQEQVTAVQKTGAIDPIESAALALLFTRIAQVAGETPDAVTLAAAPQESSPGGKNVALPPLLAYRQNKAAFAALRKAKGAEETLPADLLAQMAKTYTRKINGVGGVNPEQYFAAQLSRLQLNEVAGLMIQATDYLSRPDVTVEYYPPDYFSANQDAQQLEAQEVQLAQQIAASTDPVERQTLRVRLQKLEAQAALDQQKDQVDSLRDQRAAASAELEAAIQQLASGDLTDADRAALGEKISAISQNISDIDAKLATLTRNMTLPSEDAQRLALNLLAQNFTTLKQEEPYSQLNLQLADVLLAAWVSGDLSSDALRALTQLKTFQETHEAVWQKALEITWSIGKPVLMAFPVTSYIAIAISVLIEIHDETQKNKQGGSDGAHLVPSQP